LFNCSLVLKETEDGLKAGFVITSKSSLASDDDILERCFAMITESLFSRGPNLSKNSSNCGIGYSYVSSLKSKPAGSI